MAMNLGNLQQKQTLLRILVFTLVTVVIWVALTIFRSQQKTGIAPELLKLAEPLNPNIDVSVIERIEQKKAYSEADLQNFTILKIIRNQEGEDQITDGTLPIQTGTASSLLLLSAPTATPQPEEASNSSPSPTATTSGTTNSSTATGSAITP